MHFGQTFTNKLVSYADRHFTYNSREMKRECPKALFDFSAFGDNKTCVVINRNAYGIFVVVCKDGTTIMRKILKTYSEIDGFKRIIRCLG